MTAMPQPSGGSAPAPAGAAAPTRAPSGDPVIEMRGINVSFGGVRAVDGVNVDVRRGEVIGLVGGNGAVKSTVQAPLAIRWRTAERLVPGARPIRSSQWFVSSLSGARRSATPGSRTDAILASSFGVRGESAARSR